MGWYAEWLALWAFFAFSDPAACDRALGLALNAEIRSVPLAKMRQKK